MMTPQQIELARQFIEWEDLVNQGLAKVCKMQKMDDGRYYLFELTKNSAIAALKKREKLCVEDFSNERLAQ